MLLGGGGPYPRPMGAYPLPGLLATGKTPQDQPAPLPHACRSTSPKPGNTAGGGGPRSRPGPGNRGGSVPGGRVPLPGPGCAVGPAAQPVLLRPGRASDPGPHELSDIAREHLYPRTRAGQRDAVVRKDAAPGSWPCPVLGPTPQPSPARLSGARQLRTAVPRAYRVCPWLTGAQDTCPHSHAPTEAPPCTRTSRSAPRCPWLDPVRPSPSACPSPVMPLNPSNQLAASGPPRTPRGRDSTVPGAGPWLSRAPSPFQKQHSSLPAGWHVAPITGPHSGVHRSSPSPGLRGNWPSARRSLLRGPRHPSSGLRGPGRP